MTIFGGINHMDLNNELIVYNSNGTRSIGVLNQAIIQVGGIPTYSAPYVFTTIPPGESKKFKAKYIGYSNGTDFFEWSIIAPDSVNEYRHHSHTIKNIIGVEQLLNPIGAKSFGPLVLNRFRDAYFSDSNYQPGVEFAPLNVSPEFLASYHGFYPLNPAGNTAEGRYPDGIRIFNPFQSFGTGEYYISAYVLADNLLNDGLHCLVRQVKPDLFNPGSFIETTVSGLQDFGGVGNFPGATARVYTDTSFVQQVENQYIGYKFYFAAYNPGPGGSNIGRIRDTILTFNRASGFALV